MPKDIPTVATKRFAQRLRATRLAKGVKTARELARTLDINENRYTRYERAEVEPDLATLVRICEILKVTPNNLLCETAGLGESFSEDIQMGFSEASSSAYKPVHSRERLNENRLDATYYTLATKLGLLAAKQKAGGLDPAPVNTMKMSGEIYSQMRAAPFATIASIGREIDLSHASLEQQQEIAALVREIADLLRSTTDNKP